ncbi:putative reverse transcriptase domain-containing protein [Tanacetum coccineum]|uniref:Reverse transcriptase domain-containing protein n=1 Tax=Tanacetum coccineum TaxID=301880 RepID=A0ABQ5C8Y6_9ASTR
MALGEMIAHIEKIFEVLGCVDEFKARLASYKFEGNALNWWKAFIQAKGGLSNKKYEREYHTIPQRDGETSGELMKRFLRLAGFFGTWGFFVRGQVKITRGTVMGTVFDRQLRIAIRGVMIKRVMTVAVMTGRVTTVIRSHDITEVSNKTILLGLQACHRVIGACFTCGLTGYMARDCPKNGGNGGRGDENDNQPAAKGFSEGVVISCFCVHFSPIAYSLRENMDAS